MRICKRCGKSEMQLKILAGYRGNDVDRTPLSCKHRWEKIDSMEETVRETVEHRPVASV